MKRKRNILARTINAFLALVGLRLNRAKRQSFLKSFNSETGGDNLILSNYSVDCIIDVGVAEGTPWLYKHFDKQHLILVEPLNIAPELLEMLQGRKYEIYECAAGSIEGEITINFDTTQPSLSSIYERTELTKRSCNKLEKRTVPVKTIDQIISETKFVTENYGLKIDTEGFELEVLKGAKETLKRCKFVICEASIEKRFENSYNFSDLVLFMRQQEFNLVKILRFTNDHNGIVRFADVLFEPIN